MKEFIKKWLPITSIILLALVLRLNLLFHRGALWFDEIFSVHFSSLPWAQSIKYWVLETNPPLFTLVLKGWIRLFGSSDSSVRSLSIIFGTLTILALYFIAQKIFSRQVALISSFILTLSCLHIFLSTETRVYSLLILLSTLSFYLFYLVINEKTKTAGKILYFFTQLFLVFSHLTAVLIPIFQFITAIVKGDKKMIKKIFIINFVVALVFCLWFLPSIISKTGGNASSGWFFHNFQGVNSGNILTSLITQFVDGDLAPGIFTFFTIFLIGLSWQIFSKLPAVYTIDEKKYIVLYLILWGTIPLLLGNIFGISIPKFFAFSLPALCLLFALIMDNIKNKQLAVLAPTIFLIILLPFAIGLAYEKYFGLEHTIKYIEKHESPKSLTMIMPFNDEIEINKYYHGTQPVVGIYTWNDNYSSDERIVRFNWQSITSTKKLYNTWMQEKLLNKNKVFFLQYANETTPPVQWFIEHGWILNNYFKTPGYVYLYLYEFIAPGDRFTTSTTSTPKKY